MKWGLFGGTFDPIHFGHLRAAQELAGLLELDRVIFIPAAWPPHKTDSKILPYVHRAQMVRLAIRDNPLFSISDVENLREGKSYSIETVRHFLAEYAEEPELYFMTGQDAFDAITTWRDWRELLTLCHFLVMTRPGYENRGLKRILPEDLAGRYTYDAVSDRFVGSSGRAIYFRRTTFLDISASAIRENLRAGRSIRYLTPACVIDYIEANRLYRG